MEILRGTAAPLRGMEVSLRGMEEISPGAKTMLKSL